MENEFNKLLCNLYENMGKHLTSEEDINEEEYNKFDYIFRLTSDPNNGNLQCFKIVEEDGKYYLKLFTNLFDLTSTQILQLQNNLINNAVEEISEFSNYSFLCTSSSVNTSDFDGYIGDILSDEDVININRKVNIEVDYDKAVKEINRITSAEGDY